MLEGRTVGNGVGVKMIVKLKEHRHILLSGTLDHFVYIHPWEKHIDVDLDEGYCEIAKKRIENYKYY